MERKAVQQNITLFEDLKLLKLGLARLRVTKQVEARLAIKSIILEYI